MLLFLFLQRQFSLKASNHDSLKRLIKNFSHVLLAQVMMFSFFYLVGETFFDISEGLKFGVFYKLDAPTWAKLLFTFVLFDFALYLQHLASHRWRWFWRIHSMHHSDKMFTTSAALRFHFVEIFISAMWKGLLIVLFGISFRDFVLFELFLSSCALFNHSNIKIKSSLNGFLEKFLVTPELHRIHHSTDLSLTHSNFGFSVIIWDKLFKTFSENQDVPKVGVLGLNQEDFKSQILLKK